MKNFTAAIVIAALGAGMLAAVAQPGTGAYEERDFLTRIRRLTVDGRRAGEGYWFADARRMVFQSEREPGNPFYQIYVMDLASGEVKRISPGVGKTTCAFFRPGGDEILFDDNAKDFLDNLEMKKVFADTAMEEDPSTPLQISSPAPVGARQASCSRPLAASSRCG